MKLKSILLTGAVCVSGTLTAQTYDWRPDTMGTGVGYIEDSYFHLDEGEVKNVSNSDWDLAIPGSGNGFRYVVATNNFGTGLNGKLYKLPRPAADFGADLTADTTGLTPLNNEPEYWDGGAFGDTWGYYNIDDHSINGDTVFAYINANGAYQVLIQKYKATTDPAGRQWTIKVANLDGTDTGTYYIEPHEEGYSDEHFFFFNLEDREYFSREPKVGQWHLLATKYGDVYGGMEGVFGITGVLTAPTVSIAAVSPLVPDDADYEDVEGYNDTVRNIIGGNFKVLNYETFKWELIDSLSYFIQALEEDDQAGDIWQIYFDYFPEATSGTDVKIGLQIRKVYEAPATGIQQHNELISNFVLAPNPASGSVNLLIDARQSINNAVITLVDISGRTVAQYHKNINSGFQNLVMDISRLNAGMYMVHVQAEGFRMTEKLIVK